MHKAREYNAVWLKENFQLRQRSGENLGGERDERSQGGRQLKKNPSSEESRQDLLIAHLTKGKRREWRRLLAVCGEMRKDPYPTSPALWAERKAESEERDVIHRFLLHHFLLYLQGFDLVREVRETLFFMASRSALTAERQYLWARGCRCPQPDHKSSGRSSEGIFQINGIYDLMSGFLMGFMYIFNRHHEPNNLLLGCTWETIMWCIIMAPSNLAQQSHCLKWKESLFFLQAGNILYASKKNL